VVGRQHQHHGFRILLLQEVGGSRHRRRRVAAGRLQQDAERLDADFAHLLGHQEAVLIAAHHQRRISSVRPFRRSAVSCSMVLSETRGSSCFGIAARDSGQSRVPAPPDRITG
jgi:hypothetical protein